jgi:hypothetical protein
MICRIQEVRTEDSRADMECHAPGTTANVHNELHAVLQSLTITAIIILTIQQ